MSESTEFAPQLKTETSPTVLEATRWTRETSDLMYTEVIPWLGQVLAHRGMDIPLLMSINRFYFDKNPKLAGSFTGDEFFSSLQGTQVTDGQEGIRQIFPIDRRGLRTINVHAGNLFLHPQTGDIPGLTVQLVDQLNAFIDQTPNMSQADIQTTLAKYYQLFSALHLPPDGSGRFTGDLDSTIQFAIQQKVPNWEFSHISTNGWRIGGEESWAQTEQLTFRMYLINDIWGTMREHYPKAAAGLESHLGSKAVSDLTGLSEFKEYISTNAKGVYYELLNRKMQELIAKANDTQPNHWLQFMAEQSLDRRPSDNQNTRYSESSQFAPFVDTLDELVAAYRSRDFEGVVQHLTRPKFKPELIKVKGVKNILRDMWYDEICQYDDEFVAPIEANWDFMQVINSL